MSISATINIHLIKRKIQCTSTLDVIKGLVNSGWSLTHDKYTSYLPLGDKDDFDWQSEENMDFASITRLILAKKASGELVGLILTWKATGIGGVFLFRSDESFSMGISINRQKIVLKNNYVITDFQWYLERLLPPLNDAFGVEYFSCDQHI